jgi:Ca2+-binding EF-hand superfamily protein
MSRGVILITALLFLAGSCATTSPEPQTGKTKFVALCRTIDVNQDGRISRAELLAAASNKEEAAAIYDLCDVDKTGSITYDQAYKNRMLEQVIRLTNP